MVKQPDSSAESGNSDANVAPAQEINVLLIEDNPGDARLIKETLSEAVGYDFNLIWVNRLHAGIKLLGKSKMDVVLSDLFLPDSKGFDTIRKIKEVNPNVPIIAMTGYDDDMGFANASSNGACDYIVKQGYHYKGVRRDKRDKDGEGNDIVVEADELRNDLLVKVILDVIDGDKLRAIQGAPELAHATSATRGSQSNRIGR